MKEFMLDGIVGWDITPNAVKQYLEESKNDEITFKVNSPGGFVYPGITIFNLIADYNRNKNKVHFVNIGLSASMMSYIVLSGTTYKKYSNAIDMIHNVQSGVVGDYREMRKESDKVEALTNLLANEYVKKTKKSKKEIRESMDNETFLFGDEAVNFGIADEVIEIKDENEQNNDKNFIAAMAKDRVKECIAKMKESEKLESDIKKAASLIDLTALNDRVIGSNTIETNKITENKTEEKMTLAELKEKNLDLYNEVFNLGVQSVNSKIENIKAHLEFADVAPTEVLAAIKTGEEYSNKIHAAKYAKIQMMADLSKKRLEDDPNNNGFQGAGDTGTDDTETKNYIAELKKKRGGK